jgi:hypothetical protein
MLRAALEAHEDTKGQGSHMRQVLISFGLVAALSACGDPLARLPQLSDMNVAAGGAAVAEAPSEARAGGGLFGRLLNRQPDDPTNAAVEAALAEAAITIDDEPIVTKAPVIFEAELAQERRGLFRNRDRSDETPELVVTEVIEDPTAEDVVAAAVPEAVVAEPASPRRDLAGLFRRSPDRAAPRTGPDAQDVEKGTVMPFGAIARVCGLRTNELGTQVDAASGYRIYDTIPNSTAPRPFYITGFDDNCARTFTGAVVVTGDAQTHEFVRYQGSNERIPYTTVDNAYEALKASVCRVGRGQPCGARTASLDGNTQFLTVYNFFGGTFSAVPTKWAQILVHDGRVLAMSIKDGA